MKRQFVIIAAAVAAFFAVSCVKETPVETPNTDAPAEVAMREVTINASIDPETKTSYDAEGKFSWTKGDQISVLCSDEAVHTFTATSSGASTTFTGLLPDGVTLGGQAFFPANENHAKNSFYLAANSDALDASLPMVGTKTEGNSYEFAHCSGGFQFTIRNIPSEYTVLGAEFVTSSLKISGTYEVWHDDNGKYVYGVYGAADDSEKKYSCKVTVSDGEAKVYLPYGIGGDLWGTTTVKLVGYNETESKDLFSKDIKLGGKVHGRAVVIPVAPLVLPADLTKIDWTDSGVNTYDLPGKASSSRQALRQVKVVADKYYLYARLVASAEKLTSTASDYFGLFMYDKIDGSGDGYYGWNNNAAGDNEYNGEHAGTLNLTDYSVALTVNKTTVDVTTVVNGDEVIWTLAIPRTAHTNLAAASVNITFLTYAGYTPTGSVPEKYDPMMVVTLP
ncbi:MAG: hypothetical protein J6U97_02900 [Bacteroidaceae bacterium]|nr:hypothetical protein [Bacteroidaceae bacterium]